MASLSPNHRDLSRPPSSKTDIIDPVLPQQEQHCPLPSSFPEHTHSACDLASQNARHMAEHVAATNLFETDETFLSMPEEKTWICPPESDAMEETTWAEANRLGRSARWVVYNRASGPVIVKRVDAQGVEVPATMNNDNYDTKSPSSLAMWPRGPILLPGSMAVVEGRQGQSFVIREYKEVLLVPSPEGGPVSPLPKESSLEGTLPGTVSFLPRQTRFKTNDGALHVSGHPGRVLMMHRMGNVYIRNDGGAVFCDHDDGVNAGHGVNAGRSG